MPTPEAAAREEIDRLLVAAGWAVQRYRDINLFEGAGQAVCEFPGASGPADYLLYVDRKAVGVVEAKPVGHTLTGVERQAERYGRSLPAEIPTAIRPLPFLYQSTGVETRFTNQLDPDPRSRQLFAFHRPDTLAGWLAAEPLWLPEVPGRPRPDPGRPATLRARLAALPAINEEGLWPAQLTAIRNLEASFAAGRPRALIQMATGSGKTFTAISSIYRLIKFGSARRVLFLVDRANLGRQALREFQQYVAPDDGRRFTELYNVQLLGGPRLDPVAKVCIGTIQRLYSMLQGREMAEDGDEAGLGGLEALYREPVPVKYNPDIAIESFDVVFVDECHRSIYTLWRQVLEYFDAFLVGLTATPSKQTFGFFNRNLVMEYGHAAAVADGVNVDFDIYRIRTRITEGGSRVEAGLFVDKRDRATRRTRWERLDEDLVYDADALDRQVVSKDQIRTVIRTFHEKLFTEIFPGRREVPKTLVFAKDDAHADDIVQLIREEFGKGNDFAQKITYRSTGAKPEELITQFRNSYFPRIAVTVDMIATGTDIKPVEIVMFMRAVRSRNLFEQMKGRGVRVISPTELEAVTPDATSKSWFVIVDCVGVAEQELADTQSLERKPGVSLEQLLQAVATGNLHPDVLSSLAGRLARLDRQLGPEERGVIARAGQGKSLAGLAAALVEAIEPGEEGAPAPEVLETAARPLMENPALRNAILEVQRTRDQVIDTVSEDRVLEAGYSQDARDRARALTRSFEAYLEEHRDEIGALQVLYGKPYRARLTYDQIRELADRIEAPPRQWTTERLWEAYEALDASKVRGAPARVLSNLVRVVRYALHQEGTLEPHPEVARERFQGWMVQQEQRGRRFSAEQRQWLEAIRDHLAANLEIGAEDLDLAPFAQRGGLGAAHKLFGPDLPRILDELTEVLAA